MEKQTLKNLKEEITTLQEPPTRISKEDINFLWHQKLDIGLYPIYSLGGSIALFGLIKLIALPDIIRNPLQPQEFVELRYSQMRRIFRPHLAFIFCGFSFCAAAAKYEIAKFYLYQKYSVLVNQYLDVCDEYYQMDIERAGLFAKQELQKVKI